MFEAGLLLRLCSKLRQRLPCLKKPPPGRLLFLTYLVSVFFLAGYPVGLWLVVIGGIFYWALNCLISRTPAVGNDIRATPTTR